MCPCRRPGTQLRCFCAAVLKLFPAAAGSGSSVGLRQWHGAQNWKSGLHTSACALWNTFHIVSHCHSVSVGPVRWWHLEVYFSHTHTHTAADQSLAKRSLSLSQSSRRSKKKRKWLTSHFALSLSRLRLCLFLSTLSPLALCFILFYFISSPPVTFPHTFSVTFSPFGCVPLRLPSSSPHPPLHLTSSLCFCFFFLQWQWWLTDDLTEEDIRWGKVNFAFLPCL